MISERDADAGELGRLRLENDDLRARVTAAEAALEVLRAEAIERRSQVRSLAESLPAAMGRRTVLAGMLRDLRHHPDKPGVVRRGIAKLGRAPRKLARSLHLTP